MSNEPYVIKGAQKLVNFVDKNLAEINDILTSRGAVLMRGFKSHSLSEFQKVSEILCQELFDYKYGSTPRTKLGGKVYTSTEYPDYREIPLHNENSYTDKWPRKILFYCAIAPSNGGETPIANSRDIFLALPETIRSKFIEKGVMYTRNYDTGLDLSWQQAFQTESQDVVESFCHSHNIAFEWKEHSRLQTRQVCQSILQHPTHGIEVWFNQAHLFHESANDVELQNFFKEMDPFDYPRNAFYGDGEPFTVETLDIIRETYSEHAVSFAWEKGDLLLLDNIMYCHGRKPFEGQRKIVVTMGE